MRSRAANTNHKYVHMLVAQDMGWLEGFLQLGLRNRIVELEGTGSLRIARWFPRYALSVPL